MQLLYFAREQNTTITQMICLNTNLSHVINQPEN